MRPKRACVAATIRFGAPAAATSIVSGRDLAAVSGPRDLGEPLPPARDGEHLEPVLGGRERERASDAGRGARNDDDASLAHGVSSSRAQ